MKRKILSVLSVLMAVLMSNAVLTACSNSGKDGAQASTAEKENSRIPDESRIKELVEMAFSVTGMWLDNSTSRDFAAPCDIRPEGMLNCFYSFANGEKFYDAESKSYRFTAGDVNAFIGENFYLARFDPAEITLSDSAFQPEADGFTFVKPGFLGHDGVKQSVLISEITPDENDTHKTRISFSLGMLDAPETPSGDSYMLTLCCDSGKYLIYSLEAAYAESGDCFSREQLDFWSSDCGKSVQQRLDGDYSLVVRKYSDGTVLYTNTLGVYVKTPEGEVKCVVDAPFVYPPYAFFSDGKVTVPADDGALGAGYGINNFPYDFVYDISTGEGHAEVRAIGGADSEHYVIHTGGVTEGHFRDVKVEDGAAEIYFSIDFAKQGDAEFCFPSVDYLYDDHTRTATLYFSCVHCDKAAAALKTLERLDGVSGVQYEEYSSDEKNSEPLGTKLSFCLDEGYLLYGEVFAFGDSSSADHYRFWTKSVR